MEFIVRRWRAAICPTKSYANALIAADLLLTLTDILRMGLGAGQMLPLTPTALPAPRDFALIAVVPLVERYRSHPHVQRHLFPSFGGWLPAPSKQRTLCRTVHTLHRELFGEDDLRALFALAHMRSLVERLLEGEPGMRWEAVRVGRVP